MSLGGFGGLRSGGHGCVCHSVQRFNLEIFSSSSHRSETFAHAPMAPVACRNVDFMTFPRAELAVFDRVSVVCELVSWDFSGPANCHMTVLPRADLKTSHSLILNLCARALPRTDTRTHLNLKPLT